MNPLIGSWSGNKEKLTFGEKKFFQIDDMEGTWSSRGKTLTLNVKTRVGTEENVKRKYILDGNKLQIEGQDGEMITYRRRKV